MKYKSKGVKAGVWFNWFFAIKSNQYLSQVGKIKKNRQVSTRVKLVFKSSHYSSKVGKSYLVKSVLDKVRT